MTMHYSIRFMHRYQVDPVIQEKDMKNIITISIIFIAVVNEIGVREQLIPINTNI